MENTRQSTNDAQKIYAAQHTPRYSILSGNLDLWKARECPKRRRYPKYEAAAHFNVHPSFSSPTSDPRHPIARSGTGHHSNKATIEDINTG